MAKRNGLLDYSTQGTIRGLLGAGVPQDQYPDFPIVQNADTSQWDKRADGSDKGMGWLGLRQRPDGGVSSEVSVDVGSGDIPAMVPGLTQEEMQFLMTTPPDQMRGHWPQTILRKAADWANMRRAAGQSPFRGPDEATTNVLPAPAGVWPINYNLPPRKRR